MWHPLSCFTECGIFPDPGLNPCLLHWQANSLPLSHQGSPDLASYYFPTDVIPTNTDNRKDELSTGCCFFSSFFPILYLFPPNLWLCHWRMRHIMNSIVGLLRFKGPKLESTGNFSYIDLQSHQLRARLSEARNTSLGGINT